jgi:hypothetical protein
VSMMCFNMLGSLETLSALLKCFVRNRYLIEKWCSACAQAGI